MSTLYDSANQIIVYDEAKITNYKVAPFYANTKALNYNAINIETIHLEIARRESYANPHNTLKTVQTREILYEENTPLKPKCKGCVTNSCR